MRPLKISLLAIALVACFGGGNLSPTGDITAVTAGSGITGGAVVGEAPVAIDPTYTQRRVSGTCAAGTSIRVVDQTGTVTCETDDNTTYTASTGLSLGGTAFSLNMTAQSCSAGSHISAATAVGVFTCTADASGGITNSAGANVIMKSDGTNAVASIMSDNGSTVTVSGTLNTLSTLSEIGVRVLTVAGNGLTSSSGTVDVVCTSNSLTCNANSVEIASRDFGDLTVGSTGTTMTIDNNVVTYAKMQDVSATSRILCRITGGAGDMEECTGTQATTLLDTFSTSATTKGLTPGSNGGGSGVFLNGNGGWTTPAGGITNSAGANVIPKSNGTNLVASNITDAGAGTVVVTGGLQTSGGALVASTTVTSGTYTQSGTSIYGGGGSATIYLSSGVGGLGVVPGLNCLYSTAATADCYINAVGAAEGITEFRNLRIQNGKGADIAVFTGSSKLVAFAGDITVAGATTLGDSSGDKVSIGKGELADTGSVPTSFSGCGTGAAATGGRWSFAVTIGTSPGGSCAITFQTAFSSTPTCTASGINKAAAVGISARSTTSITISPILSGDVIDVICIGH